jgi:hypothetical protein
MLQRPENPLSHVIIAKKMRFEKTKIPFALRKTNLTPRTI